MENENVLEIINSWKERLECYNLPSWDDMPDLELYMDQVVILVNKYLAFMCRGENGEKLVTSAMINNYVKMKIIPPPVNKKYSRLHIAYLIMVCTLKQTMNISSVKKMIPLEITVEDARAIYERFVITHKKVSTEYTGQLTSLAEPLYNGGENETVQAFVLETAILANLSKQITETIIASADEPCEEETEKKE